MMDFKYIPNRAGWKDDFAAALSASLAPFVNDVAKSMGIAGPDDPNAAMFAIPQSSIDNDLKVTERPLCAKCSNLNNMALHSEEGFVHSQSLEDLCGSAKSCALCNLIRLKLWEEMVWSRESCGDSPNASFTDAQLTEGLQKLAAERGGVWMEEAPILLKSEGSDSSGYEHIMLFTIVAFIERRSENSHSYNLWHKGFTLGKLLLHDDKADSARPLLPRGDECSTLQRMREWLDACDAELDAWSKRFTDSKLPTRVLDLQLIGNKSDTAQNSDLRLLETKGISGRYATLSYCWGGYTDCMTLKSNLEERCSRILYNELPILFQQAITVTRGLGIQYLWIDALCIVQDDAEDWKSEAAQMADIYWNGVCRLAVTHCQNPTESFFPPKEIVASVRVPNLEDKEDYTHTSDRDTEDDHDNELSSSQSNQKRHGQESIVEQEEVNSVRVQDEEDCTNARQRSSPPSSDHASSSRFNDGQESIVEQSLDSALDGFGDLFFRALAEVGAKYDSKPKEPPKTNKIFFSLPKNYARDIDYGHLNSRGWVLQERLLSPRTIHFTTNHIYFEDQDDICGEDWVRRQFTWMSCVKKRSKSSRSILFPEDSFRGLESSAAKLSTAGRVAELEMQRALFGQKNYRHASDSSDSWLTIAQSYSRCNFTHMTDKLVAIAGLVKRKKITPRSEYAGSKNFFGLWEKTLHIDLAWVAAGPRKLTRLDNLKLPSWTWMAYAGPITFTKDRRDKRDHRTLQIQPKSEFHLVSTDTPDLLDITDPLPLKTEVDFRVTTRLRNLTSTTISFEFKLPSSWNSREELAAALPYIRFDHRTSTIPILLSQFSRAQPVSDQNDNLVGTIVFDEGEHQTTEGLFCAHLSTLTDDCTFAALQEAQAGGEQHFVVPTPPILAYALVLRSVGGSQNVFTRVGLAEVGYDWILTGTEQEISLV